MNWKRQRLRRLRRRGLHLEVLEDRRVLNGIPLAVNDSSYVTAMSTALNVSSTPLLQNDWDPEGSTLSASVVTQPANGTLSNFNSSTGTFTYTPSTSYVGLDSFTYKVSDGTDDSNVATVSIAVGGNFGARTNQDEQPIDGQLQAGYLNVTAPLTPGLNLIYNSGTLPRPIIVLETFLQSGSSVPTSIKAQLTFNGTAGTEYTYSTTGLVAGGTLRFALQADATGLATGRYAYSVTLTAVFSGSSTQRTYSGNYLVVNRSASTHPFGRGWQLAGLDELVSGTGGMMWVRSDGSAVWFANNGSGGYLAAAGDTSFSTLVKHADNSFTLTHKDGTDLNFSSTGKLSSRVDTNDNTISYTYSSGLLAEITDPFGRDTRYSSDCMQSTVLQLAA